MGGEALPPLMFSYCHTIYRKTYYDFRIADNVFRFHVDQ